MLWARFSSAILSTLFFWRKNIRKKIKHLFNKDVIIHVGNIYYVYDEGIYDHKGYWALIFDTDSGRKSYRVFSKEISETGYLGSYSPKSFKARFG